MKQIDWSKLTPHLIVLVGFLVLTCVYFNPLLSGKRIKQGDITQHKGMSKEIVDYREKTGEQPLWTNSMFGGMPSYQISLIPTTNAVYYVNKALFSWMPRPIPQMFICLVGVYILFLVLGVSPWLSAIGAIAYGFSTYNFLILEAGHNSKFVTMSYMAPVIAGVILTYRGKLISGGILFALALALNINANHPQITYYLLIALIVFGIVELVDAVRKQRLPQFAKSSAILVLGALLAVGTSATRLINTYEYGKESIRGASELTGEGKAGSGLDKDYALAWSYGKMETMTLMAPRFFGGGSIEPVSEGYNLYQGRRSAQAPTYWGPLPFTGGPIYHGAIICFLFLMGCFLVKGKLKWWLLIVTILTIMLSWGKNFSILTDLFFNYFPMYNKFRVVSMILVIPQLTMPILGILALHQIISEKVTKEETKRALYISAGTTVGLLAFFLLMGGGIFDFESPTDARYQEQVVDMLHEDRATMLFYTCLRSIILILLAAGVVWALMQKKITALIGVAVIGVLVLGDFWQIGTRYLNKESYVKKRKTEQQLQKTPADEAILKDKDPHYRVLNGTVDFINNATTSYYHKSIGGYHGAKLRRYNDIIEKYLIKEVSAMQNLLQQGLNPSDLDQAWEKAPVLNMLNTRYLIYNQKAPPMRNPKAAGNAWTVGGVKMVANADEEIAALGSNDIQQTAIVDQRFADQVKGKSFSKDPNASITLTSYHPDVLTYDYKADNEQLAVFSEVYYNSGKGWNAYIDGKQVPHFRTNYILRGLVVPAGKHTIEFKFEPSTFAATQTAAMVSSVLLFLLIGAGIFLGLKGQRETVA